MAFNTIDHLMMFSWGELQDTRQHHGEFHPYNLTDVDDCSILKIVD
jgi:hypothetical protein